MGTTGARSSLGWSGPLPEPELNGNVATYREVKPGIDLVVEATRTGYQQHLLVKNKAAAAQVKQLRMPWKADGLTAKPDGKGGLTVRSTTGASSRDVPAPVMWDSTVITASGEHPRRAAVGLGLAKNALVLTPDAGFLNDPKTVYPVTIDPSQSAGANFDAFVQNTYSSDQSAATELKLGSYDGGTTRAKSYLRFDGSVVSKAHPYGLKLSGPAGQGDHELVALDAPSNRSVLGWSGPLTGTRTARNRRHLH